MSNVRPSRHKTSYPTVGQILFMLARAGERGLYFLFNADKPWAADVLLGERLPPNWKMKAVFNRLKKQKYVSIKEHLDGSITVRITQNGYSRALTYQLEKLVLLKPRRWDKKWRVVIFDIPEKYKKLREIFRIRLKQLGLFQLQESVYVFPYPCFKEIEFLRELYNVSFSVRYLLVEKIEDDEFLIQHFTL